MARPVPGLAASGAGQRRVLELVHQPVDAAVVGAHVPAPAAVGAQDQPILGQRGCRWLGMTARQAWWPGCSCAGAPGTNCARTAEYAPSAPTSTSAVLAAAIGEPDRDVVRVLLVRARTRWPGGCSPARRRRRADRSASPGAPTGTGGPRPRTPGFEQPPGRVVEVHLAGFADGPHLLADAELVEHRQRVGPEPQPGPGGADLRCAARRSPPRSRRGAARARSSGPRSRRRSPQPASEPTPVMLISTVFSSCRLDGRNGSRFTPVQRWYTVIPHVIIGRWTTPT